MNRLYYGDCLTIMQEMPLASVDLIYLDPPFKSDKDYHSIYKDETGRPLPDQIEAFCDMWTLTPERERAIRQMPAMLRETGIDDSVAEFWRIWMNALRKTQPDLLAYLSYMVERLIWMKGLMRPAGSIWLHCDPDASHYIKVMLDGILGHNNFRNEITWKRTSSHSDSGTMGWVHDVLLYYTKGDKFTFNTEHVPYEKDYVDSRYRPDPEAKGRLFTDGDLTAKGLTGGGYDYEYKGKRDMWRVPLETMQRLDAENRLYFTSKGGIRVKRYLDELPGVPVSDLWADIPPVNSQAKERMGYRTQKPLKLLKRIIELSSNTGDVVFDPFCGCATTLEAAQELGRNWIGIDIAIHAVKRVARIRLQDRLGLEEGKDFKIDGVPRDLEGAKDLWECDKTTSRNGLLSKWMALLPPSARRTAALMAASTSGIWTGI